MASHDLKLSDYLAPDTELSQPDWDLLAASIAEHVAPDDQFECWTRLATEWLTALNANFAGQYEIVESDHFLIFGTPQRVSLNSLLRAAEHCRTRMLDLLPGLSNFTAPGKQIVLVFSGEDAYYAHISHYYPEGEFGRSGGIHLRIAYPHVVLLELISGDTHASLAHELTHAALGHLALPQWVEEGLAQLAEHDVTGKGMEFDFRKVRRQKEHWRKHGLQAFWSGEGFSQSGEVQEHSYQLAEILMRLLFLDFKPRWFGFDDRPLQRLLAFLRDASAVDAGQAAAIKHLHITLGQLAAKSLGPGDWEPGKGD